MKAAKLFFPNQFETSNISVPISQNSIRVNVIP